MTQINAAIVQAAPVPLAISHGITRMAGQLRAALDTGAQLVAFGETFLGGYPLWLDEAPGAALWNQPGTQALHAILLDQALRGDDPRLEVLQALVDASGACVSFGGYERVRATLKNTQYLLRPHQPPMKHRKLVPTHGERLIWGRGDGATLTVHDAGWGSIGQAICWEHWMPLLRATLHHAGESVHVAAWPTVRDIHLLASRHYAFEGRCFVVAAGTIQDRAEVLEGLALAGGNAEAEALIMGMPEGQLQTGGSAIIAPDASILALADAEETILTASLDLTAIGRALAAFDGDGHYSRPDIFELRVDRRVQDGVIDAA
ncbi:carbon-nitrogen hydrolase family protein [Sphingomonas sp.]|uniref:carbon-nitrogen hydrolase family protein n=1 Tax=Sphingomonas sp. TaxID=28214 RepID=UPI001D88FEA1|nr:carbon-nitrogen hydrolase family protein [Sphingomonas sp.]MBX9796535.1 carbon-nitrogen hydrolase family protein [Sphingomonas sp.]